VCSHVSEQALKDPIGRKRQKARFALELRYPIVPQFLDVRGQTIGAIHPKIIQRFKEWQLTEEQVVFLDNPAKPRYELVVGSKRTAVLMEDPDSLQLFADSADSYLEMSFEQLGKWIPRVDRIGARIISIISVKHGTSYAELQKDLLARFHKTPIDLPLEYTDSRALLVHKYGQFSIGPTREGDEWIKQIFRVTDTEMPAVGIALDVDSYVQNVDTPNIAPLMKAVRSVLDMSLVVEEAVLRGADAL
jgi:hypothetical protein